MLLHEGGHAISNLLRLPVLGREEDTADQIAAFVMLQFGREVARTLIKGESLRLAPAAAQRVALLGRRIRPRCSASTRYLCLAYGSDPEGFEDFVTKFRWLPKAARRRIAPTNTGRSSTPSATTILPHLDMELLVEQVRGAASGCGPDDGEDSVTRALTAPTRSPSAGAARSRATPR